ncbi:hypothetical protein MOP88_00485 [Sphingomonas sp. WKB10]|nr:hypothetical protein [Sphingomonas sp. WKB10]
MTKLTSTPAGAVLVAIDMSKNRQEVLIERPEGGRRRRMTVMATKEDYDGFVEQLAAIGRPIIVGTVRNFVREAIGWNGRDHRYGNRQGRFGPASGWS